MSCGVLTGLAAGDALGMQFETAPENDPKLKAWDGKSFGGSDYHRLRAGQWTDDTVMAMAVAETLIREKDYSPTLASRLYLDFYHASNRRGMGKATERALSRLSVGLPWTQSGVPGAKGNGTAMRAAPLGVFYRHNIQAAVEMARVDAQITHKSDEAEEGSIAVAVGTALVCDGGRKDTFVYKVLEWLDPDGGMATKLRLLPGMAEVADQYGNVYAKAGVLARMGVSAIVTDTVPAAFLAFMICDNYQETLEVAVRAGGDTDTTAAIAGALAGAFYGLDQIRNSGLCAGLESVDYLNSLDHQLWENAREPGR